MKTKGNISEILRKTRGLAPLMKNADQMSELSKHLTFILSPTLVPFITVSIIIDGTLTLIVKNSSTATKINQSKNFLVKALQEKFPEIVKINTKLIPLSQRIDPGRQKKQITFHGQKAFDSISKQLQKGPLKTAVGKLKNNKRN